MDEEEVNENLNLEDAEYSSKSDFSKAEVVKLQDERCNEIRSKEMKEGYFNYDRLGNRIYIPDSRKEWISAVIALKNLLAPEILQDEKKIFKESNFVTKENKLRDDHGIEIAEGVKVIPLLDEPFPSKKIINKSNLSSSVKKDVMIKGLFNSNFHRYWYAMVLLYDEIYAMLNMLIHENNYFKQEVAY